MSMQQLETLKTIRNGVEKFVAGKLDAKDFDKFLEKSNATLNKLAAERKAKADANWRYITDLCY
jgi:hypothetical protein